LPDASVTVVIPTLTADVTLLECLRSLENQTRRDFEVIVIDNSGRLVRERNAAPRARVIENQTNVGFGAAANQAFHASSAPYLATLNDDAVAHPEWIAALLAAVETREDVGMCASNVRLFPQGDMDSAGMRIAADGSSKQRGHHEPPERYRSPDEVLLPSGSAALYRRRMLEQVGLFDEDFFLYCEDTDLGLRARWAGWRCLYVPDAIVDHHYSHSAGRVSALKAYYVERNRLFTVIKNFPPGPLLAAPFAAIARYIWHAVFMLQGRGVGAEYQRQGSAFSLVWFVAKAHLAALAKLGSLWAQRRRIQKNARITPSEFTALMNRYAISVREVALL
jgi:GT2 family glycosyltransferase